MNSKLFTLTVTLAVVTFCQAAPLSAATVSTSQNLLAASDAPELQTIQANDGDLLRQAYHALERADHDYKGHRAKAMKQIEDAAKVLGEKVGGDGRAGEKQGVSDAQLREGQALLQQVKASLEGKGKKEVLKHVNAALEQISIALKIK